MLNISSNTTPITKPTSIQGEGYLVIGNAHLGLSERILKTMSVVSKHYGLQVVHLGAIVPDEQKKMEERRNYRIKSWERILQERMASLENADSAPKAMRLQSNIEKMTTQIERDARESKELEEAQSLRLTTLLSHFGTLSLVLNNEQHLPSLDNDIKASKGKLSKISNELHLGKYLMLAAIHPSGDKASHQPITKNAYRYFRDKGDSFITPHGAPALLGFSHEQVNKARNFYTTGTLCFEGIPTRAAQLGFTTNRMPAAVVVFIDPNTGEFHARHIFIDFVDDQGNKDLFITDDGLAFTEKGKVIELESEDKATFVTDTHAPYEHRGVMGSVRQANILHQPGEFIDGGDTADFISLNPHARGPGSTEGLRLANDLSSMARVLNAYTNGVDSIKKKTLLDSNHAEWISGFIEKNPCLADFLDWKSLSKSLFKDWVVLLREGGGDAKVYRFGDLPLRHGDKEAGGVIGAVNGPFPKYLCGHYHDSKVYRRGGSVGAACELQPSYVNNNLTAWQSAFAFLSKYKGISSFHIATVLYDRPVDGAKSVDPMNSRARFCYRNQIHSVPYHVYASERAAGRVSRQGPGLCLSVA